jgi:hypothetical protein
MSVPLPRLFVIPADAGIHTRSAAKDTVRRSPQLCAA